MNITEREHKTKSQGMAPISIRSLQYKIIWVFSFKVKEMKITLLVFGSDSVGIKFCLFVYTMIQLMPKCTAGILDMESNPIILNQRYSLTQNYDAILSLSKSQSAWVWIPRLPLTAMWPYRSWLTFISLFHLQNRDTNSNHLMRIKWIC